MPIQAVPVAVYGISEIDKLASDLKSAACVLERGEKICPVLVRAGAMSGIVHVTNVIVSANGPLRAKGGSKTSGRRVFIDMTAGTLTEYKSAR